MNYYAEEKIRELEKELAALTIRHPRPDTRSALFGPAIRALGRSLTRLGEGLESWATPSPPSEGERHHLGKRYEM